MTNKYDEIYQSGAHVLGEPSKHFTRFLDTYPKPAAHILDMGRGQGRDALFIARLGHHVTGVDSSPVGIAGMRAEASKDGLDVRGIVGDIVNWRPDRKYDVILFDRTLHMLPAEDQLTALRLSITALAPKGFILISDEKPNLPALRREFMAPGRKFNVTYSDTSRLFVQCAGVVDGENAG